MLVEMATLKNQTIPLRSMTYFSNVFLNKYHNGFLLTFISINGLISPITACINLLIICTISRSTILRTPSNVLLLGLATSDFFVGAITQPSYCVYLFSEYKRDVSIFMSIRNLYVPGNTMFAMVTLLTLTAITGDRFLAIRLHLRYKELITSRRCFFVLVLIWVTSLLICSGRLIIESLNMGYINYIIGVVFVSAVLFLNAFFLVTISKAMRRHSALIHSLQSSTRQQPLNMPKYKKSVITLNYIIGAFVLSYVPTIAFLFCFVLVKKWSQEMRSVLIVAETLLMLNGLLDPIIYCWRIKEVRDAVKKNVRNLLTNLTACCWDSSVHA